MIEEVKMYSVVCDNCKETNYDDHNGIVAWSDFAWARDRAIDNDWYEDDDKHYCPDCYDIDDDDNVLIDKSRTK